MAQDGTPEKALTPRQVAALPYLVATPSIEEDARRRRESRTEAVHCQDHLEPVLVS